MNPTTYCVDVGSIAKQNFAWARVDQGQDRFDPSASSDIARLAHSLGEDLRSGLAVALGFESPLFVPVPDASSELGAQRSGEAGRPWSGGPGGTILPTGLVQMAWMLRPVRAVAPGADAFTSWSEFERAGRGLYLWEAFVSHKTSPSTHYEDAVAGARRFVEIAAAGDPEESSAVEDRQPWFSLVGAALLWAGWSSDLGLLRGSVPVIRAVVSG